MSDSSWPHGLQHARPVPHHLLEFAQVHVHWIGDAIQLSLPLSPSSPPAFNLSRHQGIFQWVSCLYQVAKVLELQLQHQLFKRVFKVGFLKDWLIWSCFPKISQGSSPALQFKRINSSVLCLLYCPALISTHGYWKDLTIQTFAGKVMSLLFNTFFRFVITFLPRFNHLLISPGNLDSSLQLIQPGISHDMLCV